jgi:hypothetical protein
VSPLAPAERGWRRYAPRDGGPTIDDVELIVLILCNVVTTGGLAGDIARHLQHPEQLSNDFISGWHLVLYGGVASVGVWLGVGAIRRGPAFLGSAAMTVIGFVLLSLGGVCDAAWHAAFGTEAAVEALVSPPHLVVFAGLVFLLTSPVVVLWKQPARRLGFVPSVAVVASVVSAVLVISLFTGFLSPLAGGLSLQAGYVEPLVGESATDYDVVRGLGIAVWTVAVLVAAFTLVFVRFRLTAGMTVLGFAALGVPAMVIERGSDLSASQGGGDVRPLVAGFVVCGLVAELSVFFLGRPTLFRVGASVTGALMGVALWATCFGALYADDRLGWNESLWGGTVVMSALVGAAVAALVALPAATGRAVIDGLAGPQTA